MKDLEPRSGRPHVWWVYAIYHRGKLLRTAMRHGEQRLAKAYKHAKVKKEIVDQ
jgi:hypothetical protein